MDIRVDMVIIANTVPLRPEAPFWPKSSFTSCFLDAPVRSRRRGSKSEPENQARNPIWTKRAVNFGGKLPYGRLIN